MGLGSLRIICIEQSRPDSLSFKFESKCRGRMDAALVLFANNSVRRHAYACHGSGVGFDSKEATRAPWVRISTSSRSEDPLRHLASGHSLRRCEVVWLQHILLRMTLPT